VRFAVETWAPDFGSSTEADLDTTTQQVDLDVEVDAAAWAPHTPPPQPALPRVLFVDGVRRVDARLWIDDSGTSVPALCATIGAGVVCVDGTRAQLADARVVRAVFAHGVELQPIRTSCGEYEANLVAGSTPEALVLALQDRMAGLELEATLAVSGDGDMVVVDGPLRGRGYLRGAVGYVKTQHTDYLPAPQGAVIGALTAGQRTPVFAIGGPFPRVSWYTRLPGTVTHPRAGIVRCEVGVPDDPADAVELADRVTAMLPRFASAPHKDARAPQNLYPIAGLERALRRRLGDPAVLERALRVAAARTAPVR
jgi:hypothetical protein